MVYKFFYLVILSFFFLISCNPIQPIVDHRPIIPISIYPNKNVYHVGDTIYAEINNSLNLKDFDKSFGSFNYANVDLNKTVVAISKLPDDTNIFINNGITFCKDCFDFYAQEGSLNLFSDAQYNLTYIKTQDSIKLKFLIVLKKVGNFGIGFPCYNSHSPDVSAPDIDFKLNDSKHHRLNTILIQINNNDSTFNRVQNKGYKYSSSNSSGDITIWGKYLGTFYIVVEP
jgi:hypothetical protein